MSYGQRVLAKLKARNLEQVAPFNSLIEINSRLLAKTNEMTTEKDQMEFINSKLMEENQKLKQTSSEISKDQVAHLEKKLFSAQEELTELHRRRGENAQQLIDQSAQLKVQEKQSQEMQERLNLALEEVKRAEEEILNLKSAISELEATNQLLKDEYQTLQLALSSAERKLVEAQKENDTLLSKIMEFKERDVLRLNQENDKAMKLQQERIQKQLEEAVAETKGPKPFSNFFRMSSQASIGREALESVICHSVRMPTRCFLKFEAHEGEVNAIKWSPHGLTVATGGSDRRVKVWDISKNVCEQRGILSGSNGAINSLDYDAGGSLILAASTDFASRVWSIDDQRLRHTLTGHSNKVLAAKFLGDVNKVVSASYDRTLKVRYFLFFLHLINFG